MKNMILLLFVLNLQTSANVWSQQRISLKLQDVNMKKCIREIEKKSQMGFLYNGKELSQIKGINLEVEDLPLEDVLEKVLDNTNYTYEIHKKVILIKHKPASIEDIEENALLQSIEIKGKIVDKNGEPLPGANVFVKETSIGVSTDIDGNYIINVPNQEAILVFSFIGYENQETIVADKTEINVTLVESANQIDEVVVTGHQVINKERMTGAISTVTADKITNKGYTSISNALKGQLAGVNTVQVSGRPGSAPQIRIRGMNTLTGDAEPVWYVDGMPLQGTAPSIGVGGSDFTNSVLANGIGNIPVDDIESITILKDAAASAIYGARAANGVIVVTTKRGREGKSYLNIRSSLSVNEAPKNNLPMMNTQQKIDFETSLFNDFPFLDLGGRVFQTLKKRDAGILTQSEASVELDRLSNINTDWFDKIFRTGFTQNYSISLQGGDKKTQFYASVNYTNEKGVVPNNDYGNYNGSLKLTHNLNEKFRIKFDINTSYKEDITTASAINPLHYAVYANPYEMPFDGNKNALYDRTYSPNRSLVEPGYQYDLNIIEDLNNNTTNTNYLNAGINLKLEYEIIKGLMFSSQVSPGITYTNSKTVLEPGSYSSEFSSWITSIYRNRQIPNQLNNGQLRESNSRSVEYTWRNTFSYNKYLFEDHFINIYGGNEIASAESNTFYNLSPEYDPQYGLAGFPDLRNVDAGLLEVNRLGGTAIYEHKSVSYFATASYSYIDKYVVNGSVRLDGVDIVGADNRYSPLWNTSVKYNMHKENFMDAHQWINILSIRGSFGFTGSIDRNASPYPILIFEESNRVYNNNVVPSNIRSANPSIKWQRKTDRSIGLDFSLFKNKFNGTVNYYNNVVKDLLDTKEIAYSTGRPSITANVASLINKGLELSFNTVNLNINDFRWTTNFNIAFNKNTVTDTYIKKMVDLPAMERNVVVNERYFVEDYPAQSWYGYKFAGVDPSNGHALAYVDEVDELGNPIGHLQEDGKYVIDMDTEFREEAIEFLGNSYPTYTGGFGTGFIYKKISLFALFTYMGGHKIKSFRSDNGNPLYASRLNTSVNELNRWRMNGDITDVPAFVPGFNASAYDRYFFDYELEDGGFLKLSNVTLSYNLPGNLCNKLHLTRMTVSFSANNLFTWTKYKGIDPETMGAFGYPSAKRYSLNLNIGI